MYEGVNAEKIKRSARIYRNNYNPRITGSEVRPSFKESLRTRAIREQAGYLPPRIREVTETAEDGTAVIHQEVYICDETTRKLIDQYHSKNKSASKIDLVDAIRGNMTPEQVRRMIRRSTPEQVDLLIDSILPVQPVEMVSSGLMTVPSEREMRELESDLEEAFEDHASYLRQQTDPR